jgi:putative methionine-R-sulfoxide reductase with GAF domain
LAAAVAREVDAGAPADERMWAIADALWEALGGPGGRVSWVGFYLPDAAGEQLALGPHRDRPACSPIGLGGVCGRACLRREAVVVADVRALGDAYIACDPGDRSELAVPVTDAAGRCCAILDLDSRAVGAFDETDAAGVRAVLAAGGFGAPRAGAAGEPRPAKG